MRKATLLKTAMPSVVLSPSALSCAPSVSKIDPASMVREQGEREQVPEICKAIYDNPLPRIAVLNFTNNTTFDYANIVQSNIQARAQRQTAGGVAVGSGVAVWGSQTQAQFQAEGQRIERQVNAKLAESVEEGVINELVNIKGAKVFTRTDLQKVLQEQKFQMSGLVDDNTAVRIGKLAGVRYVVTGAINNVDLKWVDLEDLKGGLQKHAGLVGSVLAGGAASQEGWNISVTISVRMIDVETGEIIISKQVSGRHVIGKTPYPSYDALIGGIKKASEKALADLRPDYSKHFSPKGYIYEVRRSQDGKVRVALTNMGTQQGVDKGTVLYVYTLEEVQDPIKGTKKCALSKLPVVLKVSDQVQAEQSWAVIEGEPQNIAKVKVGQMVERAPLKGQGVFQKLGF